MKQIEEIQNEQKLCADMISRARELQQNAKNGTGDCSWDKKASVMPQDMVDFFNERGISFDTCGGEGDGTNLSYVLSNDGTLTISGIGAMKNYSSSQLQYLIT